MKLLEDLGDAQPAYATLPTFGAPNLLRQCDLVAGILSTPMIPWQRLAARVMTERRVDDPRRYRWPVVVITVPRQAGKTTLFRIVQTTKSLTQSNRRAFYTAQTGKDAGARWKDLKDGLEQSELADSIKVRLAAGSQSITFQNGSTIAPFAPTPTSLHGYTPHDVVIDEAFAFDDVDGDELMGAVGPAQQTLVDRQLVIISTAGNRESTWLRRWVDLGRAAVADPTSTIAYLEWSMPDGLDARDASSWSFHPALGHLIGLEDLAELSRTTTNDDDWARGYMNVWTEAIDNGVFDPVDVEACHTVQTAPAASSELYLAFEVAEDRSRSAILAAWTDPATQRPAVRVVQTFVGTTGLVDAILELRAEWMPAAIGADDGLPATREILEQLMYRIDPDATRAQLADIYGFHILGTKDFSVACDSLRAHVRARTVSLEDHDQLNQSARDAMPRQLGQGWAIDRVKSLGPVPEIIAAAVALRLHDNAPPPAPQPLIYSGE